MKTTLGHVIAAAAALSMAVPAYAQTPSKDKGAHPNMLPDRTKRTGSLLKIKPLVTPLALPTKRRPVSRCTTSRRQAAARTALQPGPVRGGSNRSGSSKNARRRQRRRLIY